MICQGNFAGLGLWSMDLERRTTWGSYVSNIKFHRGRKYYNKYIRNKFLIKYLFPSVYNSLQLSVFASEHNSELCISPLLRAVIYHFCCHSIEEFIHGSLLPYFTFITTL